MPGPDDFGAELVKGMTTLKRQTRQMCGDHWADADDLMQDTLERALLKRHLYTDGTNLEAWLYTIARNIWRERIGRPKREIAQPVEPSVPATQEHGINLNDVLRHLGSRAPMLLTLIDCGSDYKMASRKLGIPAGTLKSRTSRARARLAACA